MPPQVLFDVCFLMLSRRLLSSVKNDRVLYREAAAPTLLQS
jgi:hypothetical protein